MASSRQSKRVRRSQGEWRSLLESFKTSGLGVDEFCRNQGISPTRFYRWHRLLADSEPRPVHREMAPAFVDVGTLQSASLRQRLDLRLDLGDGLVLHLVRS